MEENSGGYSDDVASDGQHLLVSTFVSNETNSSPITVVVKMAGGNEEVTVATTEADWGGFLRT